MFIKSGFSDDLFCVQEHKYKYKHVVYYLRAASVPKTHSTICDICVVLVVRPAWEGVDWNRIKPEGTFTTQDCSYSFLFKINNPTTTLPRSRL